MNLEKVINQVEDNWGIVGALIVLATAAGLGYIIHRIFFAWLAIQLVALARAIILSRYDITAADNLLARKVNTQFRIVERIIVFTIILFAVAVALLTFEQVREVGVTMLTSAGIIGIIVGFAAQKTLGNLLVGIQIAISQPIRIDDAILVEGEFGRVEEINLTFVVVKLWDERRQIVPINYFIEKTFQNWTRVSTELLGTVYFYLDYNAPIEAMRQELGRILAETPLWDQKASALQVTNVKESTLEVRILVSASNSGRTFDLRCLVREKMITFLQQQYPECLPRNRVEMLSPPSYGGESSLDATQKPAPARR